MQFASETGFFRGGLPTLVFPGRRLDKLRVLGSRVPRPRRRVRASSDRDRAGRETPSTTLDRRARTGTDRYLRDWRRAGGRDALKVSYGHELERIWMLLDACQAIGIAPETMLGLVRGVFEATCRFGYDRKSGGFYTSGRLGRPAFDRRKYWWEQAEALVATATLYRLTGDTQYAHRFLRTLQWIARSQVDWRGGEWHRVIDERGLPEGPKADPWKTPYHNGRAMLLSLELLPAAD